jgi:hypothetical protein
VAPANRIPAVVAAAVAPVEAAPAERGDPDAMLAAALNELPTGLWDYLSARGWTMNVGAAERGFVGRTWREQKHSAVLVRPTMSYAVVLGSVAHEVGHMVDFECFTDADRAAIVAARAHDAWWPTGSGDDRYWGVGDWAETFALTVTGRWDGKWQSPGLAGARQIVAAHACPL